MSTFQFGEEVSYYSSSGKKWIPAKVTAIGVKGIQINHKPDVWFEPGHPSVRKAAASSGAVPIAGAPAPPAANAGFMASPLGGFEMPELKVPDLQMKDPNQPAAPTFNMGDQVQYFSSSRKQWIDTEIIYVNAFLGVQVALKPGETIPPDKYAEKLKLVKRVSKEKAAAGRALLGDALGAAHLHPAGAATAKAPTATPKGKAPAVTPKGTPTWDMPGKGKGKGSTGPPGWAEAKAAYENATPALQKKLLCDHLYPMIKRIIADEHWTADADLITRMFLELDNRELLAIIESEHGGDPTVPPQLKGKVWEALQAL